MVMLWSISAIDSEEEGYSVIIGGRTPGLDDLDLPLGAMVQYSMCEMKNGELPDDEFDGLDRNSERPTKDLMEGRTNAALLFSRDTITLLRTRKGCMLCCACTYSTHGMRSQAISGAISIDEGTVCLVAPLPKPFHSSVLIITWLEFLVIMCMGQG